MKHSIEEIEAYEKAFIEPLKQCDCKNTDFSRKFVRRTFIEIEGFEEDYSFKIVREMTDDQIIKYCEERREEIIKTFEELKNE